MRTPLNFERAMDSFGVPKTLVLDSEGGLVHMALSMARDVHRLKINTLIPERATCYSSCSFIFLAGNRRLAEGDLGVHQLSSRSSDLETGQMALSDIIDILGRFNTPHQLLVDMLRTPPEDIYVLSQEEKEAGVALIDIGGGTTDLAIFKDGIIRHTAVIPFGGNVITEDIKEGCSIIEKQAELLKIKFGSAWPGENKETEIVSIPGLRGREPKEITLKNLSKIIHARVQEIIEHVYLEIKNYGHETQKGKLIAGIVLTGGGSQLKHLRQLVEYITGMDARIGYPNEHLAGDSDDGLSSPSYATAVGLLMEGLENHVREEKEQEEALELENNQEDSEQPILESKPKIKKKSFFDKFTDGLKEFLDNAE